MSDRVCYIQRADRGAVLRGLRLIGSHTDDVWHAQHSSDPTLIEESISQGAQWIRDRLNASGKSKSLSVLCLDTSGAVCSWVKPEDADASLIDDAIAGSAYEPDPDSLEAETHSGIGQRLPMMPLELSYEFFDRSQTSTGSRSAVMANPDVPGRLLKDELDAMGIRIDCLTSIWHAIAKSWDLSANADSHDAQRIVSSDSPVAASIVLDASADRMLWTWSHQGQLITGGSVRILSHQNQSQGQNQQGEPVVRKEDLARLCSDWLGWSSQLGLSPSRIVVVGKPAKSMSQANQGLLANDESESIPSPHQSLGLSAGEIGAALSQTWPGATIDLIEHDDPIGETLLKIAHNAESHGLVSLEGLSNRPGRAHRSMYRWTALALIAISASIFLLAYGLFSQARLINEQAAKTKGQRISMINEFDPQLVLSLIPVKDLQVKLNQMRLRQSPLRTTQSKPILEELETISYVFGTPGIEIESIKVNNTTATVAVRVDDITQAEQINQSLGSIRGSKLRWGTMSYKSRGTKIVASFPARWVQGGGDS